MPQQWPWRQTDLLTTLQEPNNENWWKVFNDPNLNALIELAVKNNSDVRIALHRVEASRALRDFTAGQYYPAVDAFGSYTRSQESKDGMVKTSKIPPDIDIHSAGLDFLWEIDLFGKIKRSVESSQASYQASIEDYYNVMVTLLAEICNNYIDYRTTQARIAYARDNAKIQRETLELTKSRYEAGLVGELDVRQAEFNLANTESVIPTLLIAEEAFCNRLAVLQGKMPWELKEELGPYTKLPSINDDVTIGLPADLLRYRPDIRSAERTLAAQTAQIGVAVADLYPSLQLSGSFEIQSRRFTGLGNINNRAYSWGPDVLLTIFEGNRIRNNIKIQKADTLELLVNWQNTVLLAVEDVRNAITSYVQETDRKSYLETSVKAASRSVELVENLYKTGLTDFQNVLDTQRTLFLQQDNLVTSKGLVSKDLVQIYKAFGAGCYDINVVYTPDELPTGSR